MIDDVEQSLFSWSDQLKISANFIKSVESQLISQFCHLGLASFACHAKPWRARSSWGDASGLLTRVMGKWRHSWEKLTIKKWEMAWRSNDNHWSSGISPNFWRFFEYLAKTSNMYVLNESQRPLARMGWSIILSHCPRQRCSNFSQDASSSDASCLTMINPFWILPHELFGTYPFRRCNEGKLAEHQNRCPSCSVLSRPFSPFQEFELLRPSRGSYWQGTDKFICMGQNHGH